MSLADEQNGSPAPNAPTNGAKGEDQRKRRLARRDVLGDCRLMMRYAYDEGLPITAELSAKITRVDEYLILRGLPPLSEVPVELFPEVERLAQKLAPAGNRPAPAEPATQAPGLPPDPPAAPAPNPPESLAQSVMAVHSELSLLVKPANAMSLRVTDPDLVLYGLPPFVKVVLTVAILCLIGFMRTAPPLVQKGEPAPAAPTPRPVLPAGSPKPITPAAAPL